MRLATLKMCFLFAAASVAVLARAGQQAGSWREYGVAQGFPETAFHSVTVTESGAILAAGTAGSSLSLYDGYEAKSFPLPEGAARAYQSPAGQLWTVSAKGLWTLKDAEWKFYAAPLTDQTPLCPVRQNVVLCLTPDQLLECNIENPTNIAFQTLRLADGTKIGKFSAMAPGVEDELWIVGERGLARLSGPLRNLTASNEWREFIPADSFHIAHLQHPQPDESGVTMVADSSPGGPRRVVRFDGENWSAWEFATPQLSFAWRGPDHSYWACSSNHLFHRNGASMETDPQLSPRQYYDVAVDWRGAFWLATSAGMERFTPNLWQPAPPDEKTAAMVQTLANEGRWPNGPNRITRFDMDPSCTPAIAGQGRGRLKPIGLLKDGRVCYATSPDGSPNERNRLYTFNGTNFETLAIFVPKPVATAEISCLLATQPGDLWLGGEFGTAWLQGRWKVFAPPEVCHLVELPDGQIWSASAEKIWSFDGKDWSLVRAGFNHINAMLCAYDGGVWVGAENGVARSIKGRWIDNDAAEGLGGSAIRALCEDQRGNIWAAASNGVALYHPEADIDPPRTFIAPMSEKEKNIPEKGVIVVKFSGRDKWNVTPAGRLSYSCRLDTGDWSPFTGAGSASFSDLPPGKHYFQARAMDRAGNIDPSPPQLDFAVIMPWYKERRLVLIAFAGAVAAGFFAALAYRRHRELALSYALVEKQVAERTRELELASQELVQSQKMQALGTLAAGIAHDFNNILSIVKGSTQIIEDNLDNPEKIRLRADRIKTVVNQGSAVVQAMLGFSRGSDEISEACDINVVVDNTIKLMGDRFLRDVELCFERAQKLPGVRSSQSLVQQILLNLVFNAAESMDEQKRVIITTNFAGLLPARMALQPAAASGYVSVAVRDFGCGIPAENVPRVFEPFFTTKALSTRRGTGLGLSIVYELAKKMEAGLAVETTVGQGSVFTLFLPATTVDS